VLAKVAGLQIVAALFQKNEAEKWLRGVENILAESCK
jgi:hypothetical protein